MIGSILPYVTINPPTNCLPCDGTQYDRVDYPVLYNRLASALLVDADTFQTPDLRGQFILGADATFNAFSTGGEINHQLTEAEMPSHTHTTVPHTHSEIGAAATIINGGLEAPASAAQVFPTATGASGVTVNSAGSDQAHNNMPPYFALNYCLVAR